MRRRAGAFAAAVGVLALAAACSGDDAPDAAKPGAVASPASPSPSAVGTPLQGAGAAAALEEPKAAVARMLQHCHGPLRGTMHSVVLELRETESGPATTIVTGSGGRLRVDRADEVQVLASGASWRWRRAEAGAGAASGATEDARAAAPAAVEPLDREAHDDLVLLRRLVGGLCLLPLYEADVVKRQGPTVLALDVGGETWRLQHRRGEDLPETLGGPGGVIVFEEWLDTGVTRLPKKVRLGPFGERWVTLRTSDIVVDDLLFQDPTARPRPVVDATAPQEAARAEGLLVLGGEHKPRTPELQRLRPTMLLRLRDPGDWNARVALLHREGEALWQQGQVTTGLPILFEQDGASWLAVPFEPDPDRGSQPFVGRAEQQVERRPEQWAVVVVPPRGEQEKVMARGKELIEAFVAREKLRPTGPLRAILYVSLDTEAPKPEELQRLEVRFEQPVAAPPRGR